MIDDENAVSVALATFIIKQEVGCTPHTGYMISNTWVAFTGLSTIALFPY